MKVPFLSRLLEIKEQQLLIEKQKLKILKDMQSKLKNIEFILNFIRAEA